MIKIRNKSILLIVAMGIIFTSCNKTNNIDISSLKNINDYGSDTSVDDIEALEFGKYPKDDATAQKIEPIEWLILEIDKENKKALLMSKYIIDSEKFNKERSGTTWEKSSVRKWLNETFYDLAFNEKEKEKIIEVDVLNSDSDSGIEHSTIAGNDTKDRVFFLSIEEADKYFNNINDNPDGIKFAATHGTYFAREGKKTKYNLTGRNRLKVIQDYKLSLDALGQEDWIEYRNNNYYWLRSIGYEQDRAAVITPTGIISKQGEYVNSQYIGVRPCMWIKY